MYMYGMRLRPFSIGCQPMSGLVKATDGDKKYWNILIYDRELSEDELRNYELDYLGEERAYENFRN